MGVLAGTVTGEYEAGFLGTKAREKHRQAKIEECRQRITELETALQQLEELHRKLSDRKVILRKEYENLPKDTDMRGSTSDAAGRGTRVRTAEARE